MSKGKLFSTNHRKRFTLTTRYVVVVGIVLLAANILLGIIEFQRSSETIKTLINKDMLDLANTSAALIDGDALGSLTEEDVGSEAFNNILERLSAFQNHADIHFIYAVRQVGDAEFVFTVDADPDDPGDFGESVVVTPGMIQAGNGIAAVDESPEADRWGNYYSAFSPVFDSEGRVAGVIGVDFDADWYDDQVLRNALSITYTSLLSVIGIGVVVVLISRRVHTKLKEINTGLSELSANVDMLTLEVSAMPGDRTKAQTPEPDEDELEELRTKINKMQSNMRLYLDHLQTQVYIDSLTKVQSSTAYHELLRRIAEQIVMGSADFCVGVFDINGLKEINDQYGHENGDQIIIRAAKAIASGFGAKNTYRVGGDEFAVVMERTAEADMTEKLKTVDAEIAAYNAERQSAGILLAVSKGIAVFCPGQDRSYKDVFSRADQMMYEDKKEYYRVHPDRRGACR